jgi:hypothetical protein
MHAFALSALPGLAAVLLLTGCGHGDRVIVMRDVAPAAQPALVDQPLPAWHPVLPEGHPPVPGMGFALPQGHPPVLPDGHPSISGEECPAGGMSGFSDTPVPGRPAPEIIST